MSDLIKITTNEEGKQLVSARELHEKLILEEGKEERFSQWFKRHLQYGFEENIDYAECKKIYAANQYGGKRELIDYAITIDMAKEICMLQKSDKGREFRKYFIECEKKLKAIDNKAQLLLDIYNGGEKAIAASKKLHEIEAAPIKAELKEANIQLQKDKQWWSIKRTAIMTNTSWKDYSWKKLKAASLETGHEVKKVFDANFGAVNAYHEDAWKEVYPEIYNEIMK